MLVNPAGCDFVDFGSGVGGCIDFARKKLHGQHELGIEVHRGRYEQLKAAGYNVVCADVSSITLPKKSVSFVTISHVLEHLDSVQEVRRVLETAVSASRDFVFIEGPAFDFDLYLAAIGLKFSWSAGGHDHTTPITSRKLLALISAIPEVTGYSFLQEVPAIKDSSSSDLHPATSPPGVCKYDPKIHPPKPMIKLQKPIYRSFVIFVWCAGPRLELLAARSPKFERTDKLWWQ